MNNEIKNTLFRFVTMRAPELSEEEKMNQRFVFRKKSAKNTSRPFDAELATNTSLASNWDKMRAITNAYANGNECFKDLENIKTTYADLYKLGVWIAKNKYSYDLSELQSRIGNFVSSGEASMTTTVRPELTVEYLSDTDLDIIWNNLFYQVLTEKDFYIKETLMQLLIANHVINNYPYLSDDNKELTNYIVNARVVLPKELFVEPKVTTTTISGKATDKNSTRIASHPSETMLKLQNRVTALKGIERYTQLKKELEKAEKRYRKEYQKAYDLAQKEYQVTIEPLVNSYHQELKNAQTEWCSQKDPKTTTTANDPCHQPREVPQPKLPKFEFEFRKEMDLTFLQQILTEESFLTLLELYDIPIPDPSSLKYGTTGPDDFDDTNLPNDTSTVYGDIGATISIHTTTAANSTTSQADSSLVVNGVVVPVAHTNPVPFWYEICPQTTKIVRHNSVIDFLMLFAVPDSTWQIASVTTKLSKDDTLVIPNTTTHSRVGNEVQVIIKSDSELTYDKLVAGTLENMAVSIAFTNGAVKTFDSGLWNTFTCFVGQFHSAQGVTEVKDEETTTSNTMIPKLVSNTFVPSGFGVKQLGIADYKRVEQTVQGYVEGDVAHIENIMAREYKEKATRKLRRSENTTTTSSESEREQLSDTTTNSRFEMQSEVSKVLQEDRDYSAGTQFNTSWGLSAGGSGTKYNLGANVNMGSHSSKEDSTRQAVTQAKDVTERAMERIVSKVKEERIEKIIEEFEENNKHGYDNTKGDKHVVGVYRWVDKLFKNQIYNFGKRLLFEFMIPEPAKLHVLGMTENKNLNETVIVKPVDPRKYEDPIGTNSTALLKLTDYRCVNETTAKFWGSLYNVDLKAAPDNTIFINKSISGGAALDYDKNRAGTPIKENVELQIPEGYETVSAKIESRHIWDNTPYRFYTYYGFSVGNITIHDPGIALSINTETSNLYALDKFRDKITITGQALNNTGFNLAVSLKCQRTAESYQQWQQETFKAILDAYDDAWIEYNQKLAQAATDSAKIKGENPGFYRQIENLILRKNCISYIISQNEASQRTYGKSFDNGQSIFNKFEIQPTAALDDYATFVKFIEQAFEWDIMSYTFYPYYWGARADWAQLYQYDNNDPLFRNFMQAGMARVIVTVRPGFEEAVRYYMQTGQIWNGGEVPVIEDKLFLSIVDELREPEGKKEGKAWWTRLPTALTMLQAQTIGLNVTQPLPYNENDMNDFENPEAVPRSQSIELEPTQLGVSSSARIVGKISGNENKEAKIVLRKNDVVKNLTYCDTAGYWELNNIPAGDYTLDLDANDDFPATSYQVTVGGSKHQNVTLASDQLMEVNITIAPLS